MKKEKVSRRTLGNNFFMLREIFRISPSYVILNVLGRIMRMLPIRLVSVLGTKVIIDMANEPDSLGYIIGVIAAMVASLVIGDSFAAFLSGYYSPKAQLKIAFEFNKRLYEHAHSLDLVSYDNTEFYNDFILAVENARDPTGSLNQVIEYIAYLITLVTMGSVIISFDFTGFLIILLSSLVFIPLNRKATRLDTERWEKIITSNRKKDYFARVFWQREYAEEVKMNGVKELLFKRFDTYSEEALNITKKYSRKTSVLFYIINFFPEYLGRLLLLTAYLGYKIMVAKTMTPGVFVALFNGAGAISRCIGEVTIFGWGNLERNGEQVEKLRRFLEIRPAIKDGEHEAVCAAPEKIVLRDVSFTYPGNEHKTLDGINLEIAPGEKLAIVGFNGAGKTTLTNLLLRLYDTDEGEITIGGRDIREETLDSHRKRFACAFQDFRLFASSVGENVAMDSRFDKERVLEALADAKFEKELPGGVDTTLTREFDEKGMNLSGGEKQKIVIARTFFKSCPYVIMDEPSANLDPVAEYELNRQINDALKDRTVIFISHRLSTTRHADRIAMMENGKIIELGTHAELMALDGKYAGLFNMQAEKYLAQGT